MSGSAVAQAIAFALSPVISRLFTPADFGVFGSFAAASSVIGAIVTLDYSQAVMLPKHRDEAGQVFLLSCLATLAVTLVCGAVCILMPHWVLGLLKTGNAWLLVLLVLSALAAGLNLSFQAWCIRVKAFKATAASQVVRGISANGMQVGFGFVGAGSPGLVVSSILSEFFASVNLFRSVRADLRAILPAAHLLHLKALAVDYRDFPLYSGTTNALNALSQGFPVLLLAHFYGIEVAGAYAFGMRILNAPINLVTGAVRQVLFQKASETHHDRGRLLPLYLLITGGLFALAFLPSLVIFLWSPAVFVWLFGMRWQAAGDYARWLIIWLMLGFCNVPAVLFSRIIRIQRTMFVFQLLVLFTRVLALVGGGLYLSASGTILLFSLVGGGLNVAIIAIVGRALTSRETCTPADVASAAYAGH